MLLSSLDTAAVLTEEESMQNHSRLISFFVPLPLFRRNRCSMRITKDPHSSIRSSWKKIYSTSGFRCVIILRNKCFDLHLINASFSLFFSPWSRTVLHSRKLQDKPVHLLYSLNRFRYIIYFTLFWLVRRERCPSIFFQEIKKH